MPDDRPESPEERVARAMFAAENPLAIPWERLTGKEPWLARARVAVAALSTPAGPSPEDGWTYTTETPKSADLFGTAPSPREGAVEARSQADALAEALEGIKWRGECASTHPTAPQETQRQVLALIADEARSALASYRSSSSTETEG